MATVERLDNSAQNRENNVMNSNRRSKNITEGVARAPNRSMY